MLLLKKLIGLDKYDATEIKTKHFVDSIKNLPIEKDCLFVIPEKNATIAKSASNLPHVKTIQVNYLNIADLQKYDTVVFLEASLGKMEEVFLTK